MKKERSVIEDDFKWDDVYCPRCGEPLGVSEMPGIYSILVKTCYTCGGRVTAARQREHFYVITYSHGGKL